MKMTNDSPQFYNSLELSLYEAKRVIEAGAKDRQKSAHNPVIGTIDASGAPSQRVMILREVDWTNRTLRFHTDARSVKIGEANDAASSVLFYEPNDKVQLRLGGIVKAHRAGPLVDAAWEQSTLFARRCYMTEQAPGSVVDNPVSGLPHWIEGKQPTAEDIEPNRQNFAILLVEFTRIEWLYLANAGHRRAQWIWNSDVKTWDGSWLIP